MSERVLTLRELNRALLARQLLLERTRLPVVRTLERVAGLQAQDVVAPFVGLWTRLAGFERDALTRALRRRTAVRGTLMRGTIHLVSARDYALFARALLPMIQALYQRYLRDREPIAGVDGLTECALAYARQPRTNAEMREYLGGEDAWWRVRRHTLFVNAPGPERWGFARTVRLVAADAWLDRPLADPAEGLDHLISRYLAAFGPAGADDVSTWTGLSQADLRPALERLTLRHFRDERGRLLFDVPGAALPDPAMPAPARFLPAFDNVLLSHADRTRVIADEHRRVVIRGGLVDPTFLVDGLVAGTWKVERRKETATILLAPFASLTKPVRGALAEEGERLVRWIEDDARAFGVRWSEP